MTAKKLPAGTVYAPVDWTQADAMAIQAVAHGTADEMQQQRAFDWIMVAAAATYDFHYRESERDTAFALGRAFVGQEIRKLLNLTPDQIGGKNAVGENASVDVARRRIRGNRYP